MVDGNEHLGWLATAVFLEINGTPAADVANEAVYELVVGVAAGTQSIEEIAHLLRWSSSESNLQ